MLKASSFLSMRSVTRRILPLLILACLFFALFRQTPYYENAKDKAEPYLRTLLSHPAPESDVLIPSEPHVDIQWEEDSQFWPYRRYRSSPWTPPYLEIERREEHGAELADGHLFLTPSNSTIRNKRCVKQAAPFIVSQVDGDLIYAFNETSGVRNFRAQHLNNSRHLTLWRGQSAHNHGFGEVVVIDEHYSEKIVSLNGSSPSQSQSPKRPPGGIIDFHEQQATDRGTLLVTAYNSTPAQLESLGRFRPGWILDSQFYEIEPATGEVLFSWSALDHISVDESRLPVLSDDGNGTKMRPWDFFHISSVQRVGDDYLICARHTWAIYLISGQDGHVVWKINGDGGSGSGSDFGPLPEEAQFRWAHHARAHNVTRNSMHVSLFDNHVNRAHNHTTGSRGIVLGISLPPDKLVSPVLLNALGAESGSQTDMVSAGQGNFQAHLSNGNQLVGFGTLPVVREYGRSADGSKMLWEGRFGYDLAAQSYRTGKYVWHGVPEKWDPSLVIERGDGEDITGFVSWNGATDIEAWNVYTATNEAGDDHARDGTLAGKAAKKGFETRFELEQMSDTRCVRVAAIQQGLEIRLSNWACLGKAQSAT